MRVATLKPRMLLANPRISETIIHKINQKSLKAPNRVDFNTGNKITRLNIIVQNVSGSVFRHMVTFLSRLNTKYSRHSVIGHVLELNG